MTSTQLRSSVIAANIVIAVVTVPAMAQTAQGTAALPGSAVANRSVMVRLFW